MHSPSDADTIIAKKTKYLLPCLYHFYKAPPVFVRGEGMYLIDQEGKHYLDLYCGVSVNALGHCHPEIIAATCEQIKTLQHTTSIYLTDHMVALAKALARILPGKIKRSFFCASGSEANEGAALLAALHTGRNTFFALENSLHGRTKLAMSLTGLDFWRTDPEPVPGITHLPRPDCAHCPWGQALQNCDYQCVTAVKDTIELADTPPAGMFVEAVQGNGGIHPLPPEYLPRLKNILSAHSVLLIVDEVQTGFGRTGKWFAVDHWGVEPDIITGGKALGGSTPIGFFATNDKVAASYTRPGASTFGGNPVTCAAALAFLTIVQRDKLVKQAAKTGAYLQEQLTCLAQQHACVKTVRGLGLMLGLELAKMGAASVAELTDFVLEQMKNRGFLLGKTGSERNVLTFMPPLTISHNDIDRTVVALGSVFLDCTTTQ